MATGERLESGQLIRFVLGPGSEVVPDLKHRLPGRGVWVKAKREAIAAAVIGGTSLAGGQGTILGTVLGALLMAALRVGLRMVQLQPYWQMFWLGVAIVVAVIYDRLSRRRAA